MSFALALRLPPDLTTLDGRLAERIYQAKTDGEYAALEKILRDVAFAFGKGDPDAFIRHLVVRADDRWGLDAEQWRTQAAYRLHAGTRAPHTPAQLARIRRRLNRQGWPA